MFNIHILYVQTICWLNEFQHKLFFDFATRQIFVVVEMNKLILNFASNSEDSLNVRKQFQSHSTSA